MGIGGNPIKGQEPSVFVNVDTTTVEGLKRAKRLGLAQSGLADTIVTTYVHELHELFDKQHRGRLFAMFRHPVDRAVSLFHYLKYVCIKFFFYSVLFCFISSIPITSHSSFSLHVSRLIGSQHTHHL